VSGRTISPRDHSTHFASGDDTSSAPRWLGRIWTARGPRLGGAIPWRSTLTRFSRLA